MELYQYTVNRDLDFSTYVRIFRASADAQADLDYSIWHSVAARMQLRLL